MPHAPLPSPKPAVTDRRVACAVVFALVATALGARALAQGVSLTAQRSGTVSGLVAKLVAAPVARARVGGAVARTRLTAPAREAEGRTPAADARAAKGAAWLSARGILPSAAGATYLAEMVTGEQALLRRWEDRRERPLRVSLARGDSVPGWRPEFDAVVRQAFAAWERTGVPVRFVFVDTPENAEVHVTWAGSLPNRRAGVTHWTGDADGWLARVTIVLATRVSDGTRADAASVRRITLHEVGHLIGLEHSTDPNDVMAPYVRVGDLTPRDQATARLLYTVAPGRLADADRVAPVGSAVPLP